MVTKQHAVIAIRKSASLIAAFKNFLYKVEVTQMFFPLELKWFACVVLGPSEAGYTKIRLQNFPKLSALLK
jgi:hypothetical protein